MKKLIIEQYSSPEWKKVAQSKVDELRTKNCNVQKDSDGKFWCKVGSCNECPAPPSPSPSAERTPPPTPSASAGTPTPTPTPTPNPSNGREEEDDDDNGGVNIPDLSRIEQIITNALGRIISWFGRRVDDTGEWMKKTFTKSDYERAMEDCYKVPFKDEDSAKKALENNDIVDYYELKDTTGNTIFLGKAWDCENKGGMPPCFKKLAGGKYDSSKQAYIEEYFDELSDAGVYEYYCNGSVAFKPYYESDETGSYVESSRPKVWYKWDPKTGVINKP